LEFASAPHLKVCAARRVGTNVLHFWRPWSKRWAKHATVLATPPIQMPGSVAWRWTQVTPWISLSTRTWSLRP